MANSAEPDEMPNYVAFHNLRCLQNMFEGAVFRIERVKAIGSQHSFSPFLD